MMFCNGALSVIRFGFTNAIDSHMPQDKIVSIPLDPMTLRRLIKFGDAVGKPPIEAASDLLRDLLADDEFWNAAKETSH